MTENEPTLADVVEMMRQIRADIEETRRTIEGMALARVEAKVNRLAEQMSQR